jgi:DNA polymerase-3 subunit delta'
MAAPYPWQGAQWVQCQHRIRAGTLPHALLLSGPRGLGKLDFARGLARRLLCDRPGEAACGSCKGCRLFLLRSHPDYMETAAEGNSEQIKIDQIRALNYFISLSRKSDHYKIALIVDPDTMTKNAANSLLKTLEEPPPFSLILLVSSRSTLLPPTILSRCQRILFKTPPHDIAVAWLKHQASDVNADALIALACGEPLTALELSTGGLLNVRRSVFKDLMRLAGALESVVAVAGRWQQCVPDLLLSWLLSWLTDIAKLCSISTFNRLNNPDIDQDLRRLAERIDLKSLFSLYETVLRYRRLQIASLNQRLMLEDILLAWTNAFKHI